MCPEICFQRCTLISFELFTEANYFLTNREFCERKYLFKKRVTDITIQSLRILNQLYDEPYKPMMKLKTIVKLVWNGHKNRHTSHVTLTIQGSSDCISWKITKISSSHRVTGSDTDFLLISLHCHKCYCTLVCAYDKTHLAQTHC